MSVLTVCPLGFVTMRELSVWTEPTLSSCDLVTTDVDRSSCLFFFGGNELLDHSKYNKNSSNLSVVYWCPSSDHFI